LPKEREYTRLFTRLFTTERGSSTIITYLGGLLINNANKIVNERKSVTLKKLSLNEKHILITTR